jgi:predicted SnoaL-like aldol condensation-catalyzing enzyme
VRHPPQPGDVDYVRTARRFAGPRRAARQRRPELAANKQLVYDMYRIVLQGGHWDRAHEFIAEDYIQHNPNAAQGLQGLIDYVRASRPVREIKDTLDLPLIMLVAEGDYVTTAFVRPEKDAEGETYYSSWFDLYRIEDGRSPSTGTRCSRATRRSIPTTRRSE